MYLYTGDLQQKLKDMKGIEEKKIFERKVRLGEIESMNRAKQ